MILKKVYQKLVTIRKELQVIRRDLEPVSFVPEDSNEKHTENLEAEPVHRLYENGDIVAM